MKRFLSLFLLIVFLLCPPATAEEDWYLETAKELAVRMGELVQDELYQYQYLLCEDSPAFASLKATDFQNPSDIWSIPISGELAGEIFALYGITGAQSEFGMEQLLLHMTTLLITNGIQEDRSYDAMLVQSAYAFSRTRRMPENFAPHFCLLEFDHALLAVAFTATGESCVTLTVTPVFVSEGTTGEAVAGMLRAPLSMLEEEE